MNNLDNKNEARRSWDDMAFCLANAAARSEFRLLASSHPTADALHNRNLPEAPAGILSMRKMRSNIADLVGAN